MDSTTQTSSPFAGPLGSLGLMREYSSLPLWEGLSAQIEQAIKTGGVGSGIPLIGASVGGARQAYSRALTDTAESLGRRNVTGSTAEEVLGNLRMSGGQQINQIPAEIASKFIGMGPQFAGDAPGIGELSSAGGLSRTSTYTPSFWDTFNQGIQTGANVLSAATGGGSGTPSTPDSPPGFAPSGGGGPPWWLQEGGYPDPYLGP